MDTVDTSSYPKPPPTLNPIDAYSKYVGIQHTQQQNQLLQQEVQGRIAVAQAIKHNTGPDGRLQRPGFLHELSQSPSGWLYLEKQQAAMNANPPVQTIGTNAQGQPTPAQGSFYDVFDQPPQEGNALTRQPGAGQMQPSTQGQSAPTQNQLTAQPSGQEPPPMGDQGNALTGNAPPQRPPSMTGQPAPGEVGPPMSQEMVDKLHAHNETMLGILEPLVKDPNLDHKKVIRATADLVAHPGAEFNATDGATALSKIPYGPNGQPPDSAALHARVDPLYKQLKQQEALLSQRFPSSSQLQARQPAPSEAPAAPVNLTMDENTVHGGDSPLTMTNPRLHATGVPAGYKENLDVNQTHYQDVLKAADNLRTTNAALSNVYNLSKSGAPTGQLIGSFYSSLASMGLAPAGAQTAAEELQQIHAHSAQIATSFPNRTDQDLFAHQLATVSLDDLPKVIQKMVPYLKAVNNAKIAQANYYQQQDPTGQNPTKIANSREEWRNMADPLIFEMHELAQSDPKAFEEFVSSLDPVQAKELKSKYQTMFGSKKLNKSGLLK